MRKVIIDTNMLLVPGQHKVDIFTELDRVMDEQYEIIVLKGTLEELQRIIDGKTQATGADKQAAKLAQLLVKHHEQRDKVSSKTNCKALKIVSGSKHHVDDAIVEIAEDAFVATNDSGLKRRLLEKGIRVISLKQQKYLAIST